MPPSSASRYRYLLESLASESYEGMPLVTALDGLPFYAMLVDSRHRILYANATLMRVLRVNPENLLGQYCPKAVHGCEGPFPGCPLEEAVAGGEAVVREFFDEESGRWFRSSAFPTNLRTKSGDPVFLHAILDITSEVEARERLAHRYEVERVLREVLATSFLPIPLADQLGLALEAILSLPGIRVERKGSVFLNEGGRLVMAACRGLSEAVCGACREVPHGRCLCGRAAATGEVQIATDLDERHEVRYPGIVPHGHCCLPVKSGSTVLGVLNLYLPTGLVLKDDEVRLLETLGAVVGKVIAHGRAEEEVVRGHQNLQEVLTQTVAALATAAEQRDPYTAGHQQRVTELACAIARELGLSEDRIRGLHLAGLVHDVGKLSVPSEILNKPGPLSQLEFPLVQDHVTRSYEIVRGIAFPWPVAEIIYQHHERVDGSGYPHKLKGEEILLESRILAVADVVEAMSSHRPYREALGLELALAEIEGKRGQTYDAAVVDACLRLFRDRGYTIPV